MPKVLLWKGVINIFRLKRTNKEKREGIILPNLELVYTLEADNNEQVLNRSSISEQIATIMGYEQSTKENFRDFTERRWRYEKAVTSSGLDPNFMSYHDLADEAIDNHLTYLVENGLIESHLLAEGLENGDSEEELFQELSGVQSSPKNFLDGEEFMDNLYVEVVE